MNAINIPTFLNIDLTFSLSGVGKRFGAFFTDWFIKVAYVLAVTYLLNVEIFSKNYFLSFVVYLPFYFYTFLFEWLWKGQTIGKKLMRIRVIGMDGNIPSMSQCAIRWMFLFADAYALILVTFINPMLATFSFLGPVVGAVLIGNTKNQQRLGDMAAKTYVVSVVEDHYSINDTIYAYVNKHSNYEVKYPQVMKLSDKDMTIIKNLLEKSENQIDNTLAHRLAVHVQKILRIETEETDFVFLKNLLRDYNHLTINEK
jgi:uncharacterized RDD family membrane protein YckC